MDRELLQKPFPPGLVKTRKGAFNKTLHYVEGQEYVKRLLEATAGDYSFSIVEYRIMDMEVMVLGKLEAGGTVKMAFGGSSVTRAKDSGEPISLVDDLKAAATDSLKKACSLEGVGLHLYGDGNLSTDARGSTRTGNASRHTRNAPPAGRRNGGNGGDPDRLSQRQLSSIWSLGRRLGLNADEIRQRSVREYGVVPEFLSRQSGSSFISALVEQAERGAQ